MRSPILLIRLFVPDPPSSTNLNDKSWLLTSFIQVPDQTVLGFGAAGATKDESLGRLFPELEPDEDGQFTVELGAILLQPLPNLNGQIDYTLEVSTEAGPLQICFSNQLARLRHKINDDYGHALCPRYRLEDVLSEDFEHVPEQAHVEYLPTVATCRFRIAGQDAEDALEGNIEDCISRFVTAINKAMSAHVMLSTDANPILTPTYDRFSFDYFYLLIEGRDPLKVDGQRISPNVFRAALAARDYDEEESARFIAYVDEVIPIDDVPRILRAAKGYLDAGLNEFALLQLAIAAEIATTRAVHQLLRFAGVSRSKLDDMGKEMTFSRMLNLDVTALAPPGKKPDPNLIGSINRIRTLRNATMHEAQFAVSKEELRRLFEQADEYIRFLDDVLEYRGLK